MSGIVKNQVEGKLKDSTKNVKFKSLYTWARVTGFVCTLIVLGMVFRQFEIAPGCAALAVAAGCITFFVELICCFKCCTCSKACATKIDDVLSYGPFFKGTLYFVIAICGFIAYHFEMTMYVDPDTHELSPRTDIGVLFDFILFAIPGVLYILAFIITDKCKLRQKKNKKGGKDTSDIEEQFPAGDGPHEYKKKNIFSKKCKYCDAEGPEECARLQEEAAAARQSEATANNPFEKMKTGLTSFGEKLGAGFKDLGAKMKIGTPRSEDNTASQQMATRNSRNSSRNSFRKSSPAPAPAPAPAADDGEVNPFARSSSSSRKQSVREENPFL